MENYTICGELPEYFEDDFRAVVEAECALTDRKDTISSKSETNS